MPNGHKNLLFIHLESISWQTLNAFPESFPNLLRIMSGGRRFRSYYSSATSTQMVMAFLLHGNDFEFDAAPGLSQPAANNPSLFSTLEARGYRAEFLGVSAFRVGPMLPPLARSLPPVWTTDDFAQLIARFEAAIAQSPFAVYVWNLVTHIEHAMALHTFSDGTDDLLGGACAVADRILGALYEMLERRGLLDDTIIVLFGDHGDDFWTHGFKRGFVHGTEPYTHVVHAPLIVCDPALPPVDDHRLASTVDIAPTCLDLLGIPKNFPFAESGVSLVSGAERSVCFSQNFTANQPDAEARDVRKAFAVNDGSYALLASTRGLELFNHRLDPTNHCNLLHFCEIVDGELMLDHPRGPSASHFGTVLQYMVGGERTIPQRFKRLQNELVRQVTSKNRYVAEHGQPPFQILDPSRLQVINRTGQSAFFDVVGDAPIPLPNRDPRQTRTLLRNITDAMLGRGRHVGR
ncbi:MAG: sulfatase-like hydrolase/transferase [Dongiaceae bacterium]